MARSVPISREHLAGAFARFPVYNIRVFLDAETGELLDVPGDLIDYCLGHGEGTDLQLSDSHDLPAAQRIAGEIGWLAQGFDDEGMAFGTEDQRFLPIEPAGGAAEPEIRAAVQKWLDDSGLETVD